MEIMSTSKMLVLLLICMHGVGFVNAYWGGKSWNKNSRSNIEGPYAAFTWTPAHATFYGGEDGSGTMGGACGYGNLHAGGYGTATAAMSPVLFNKGLTCGACFEIKCDIASGGHSTKWCHRNAGSIKITGTNLCPSNEFRTKDGWCNEPKTHFDLAYPSFAKLAERVAGIIPIQYRRVGCARPGGLKFCIGGNPWFNLVLVYNVAGAGNVVQLAIKGSRRPLWYTMKHNWGQNWENHNKLVGDSLSFRVTLGTGKVLSIINLTDKSWQHGLTYQCTKNFDSAL